MEVKYALKRFGDLSPEELYTIMQLRQQVFAVEQNCPYQDADHHDQASYHLCGYSDDNHLIAYSRLVPPDEIYKDFCSIGRVINDIRVRGRGIGRNLMRRSVEIISHLFPEIPVKISAQTYLIPFYESFGFKRIGEVYLEDNTPHIQMVRHYIS
jgi:ElaA protein